MSQKGSFFSSDNSEIYRKRCLLFIIHSSLHPSDLLLNLNWCCLYWKQLQLFLYCLSLALTCKFMRAEAFSCAQHLLCRCSVNHSTNTLTAKTTKFSLVLVVLQKKRRKIQLLSKIMQDRSGIFLAYWRTRKRKQKAKIHW